MLPDMTPGVTRALEAAQRWSARLQMDEIAPEDLLAGLIEEDEGRAVGLLQEAGLDVLALRQVLASRPAGDSYRGEDDVRPYAAVCRTIFLEARDLARTVSLEGVVSTEWLLLALIRERPEILALVEGHGLVLSRLESVLFAAAGPPLQLDTPLELAELDERIETARVLDATANRAREALRVLEDYCRFCLDDAFLTGELKRLRHQLSEILALVPDNLLLAARETLRDVGTTISTPTEYRRHSLHEVARANLSRLQEALRSLEEFGKLLGVQLGPQAEAMRYIAYTLDRALLLRETTQRRLDQANVQILLTGAQCAAALDWTIAEAAAGGATVFQLREKHLSDRELLQRARRLRACTRELGVLFLVNDRPDIARLVEADGVHLGQDDLPVKDARRILGPDALIGVSTHNLAQLEQAVLDGASHVGVGPTFPSATKEFEEFAGLEFVREASARTSLPQFIIGGINAHTLPQAVAAGARRIAVSQAVCQADEPRAAVMQLLHLLAGGK